VSASAPANTIAPATVPASADPIAADVARLGDLDLHELRVRWRKLFRKEAPPHLSRFLLHRMLAYRIQANAYGDLDRETIRFLDRIAKQRAKGTKSLIPPVEDTRAGRLKAGTVLVREHDGALHQVTVVQDGFAWNGIIYDSLSAVARAITGTNWNGPRFFGLRDRKRPQTPQSARAEARP
jgi:hypothetical protein